MEYQRFSFCDMIKKLLSVSWINAASKSRKLNLGGDMKGDAYQNGGALIVDKNGKQLFEYIQQDAAEHINAEDIFKALKIQNPNIKSSSTE